MVVIRCIRTRGEVLDICFDILLAKIGMLRSSRPISVCFDNIGQFRFVLTYSTKFWYVSISRPNKKLFDFVRPCSDIIRLSRPQFDMSRPTFLKSLFVRPRIPGLTKNACHTIFIYEKRLSYSFIQFHRVKISV